MPRSSLFRSLRRAMRLAHAANHTQINDWQELLDPKFHATSLSRRRFLGASAAGAAALLGGGALLQGCGARMKIAGMGSANESPLPLDARIVIVGAGLAGLCAAHHLAKSGVRAALYDAQTHAGGRVLSGRGVLAPGLVTELGGEFIDTGHEDMLALAREFDLPLIDTAAPSESALTAETYYFGGLHYSEHDVVEAFRLLAARMAADLDALGETIDYANDGGASALDRMSIEEYLGHIGASGWVRDLLSVAYVTEYGLDADEQSALNLLFLIATDVDDGFKIFGDSDERFKILGGNDQIPAALASTFADQIHLEQRLLAVAAAGAGFRLTFEEKGGATRDVDADVVIMTIPFTLLRDVALRVDLPPVKRKSIDELGYGTNAKLMMGFSQRLWRDQGRAGNMFTDLPMQSGWDNSRQQPVDAAGFTAYLGGSTGAACVAGTPNDRAAKLLPQLAEIFPGADKLYTGRAERFHWPTFPWTRGSYACYRPGQWTTIGGAEGLTVGNLYFAGEHCSIDFQGYMNGAAETGRQTAETIFARMT